MSDLKIFTDNIEPTALNQIYTLVKQPAFADCKGAISAKAGEKLLIPINMRDGCIIGIGKGNEDWNCSAPHGAGRVMSRSKAKELVSLEEYEDSMKGIFTTSVSRSTIDESPMAYKTMEEIIANIADTVEVVNIIKPVYNFKASE